MYWSSTHTWHNQQLQCNCFCNNNTTHHTTSQHNTTMGASYNILGKQVASQWLAIATLAGVVGGIKLNSFLAADAPAADAPAAPAPAAGELDVEKAINDFLASSDDKTSA